MQGGASSSSSSSNSPAPGNPRSSHDNPQTPSTHGVAETGNANSRLASPLSLSVSAITPPSSERESRRRSALQRPRELPETAGGSESSDEEVDPQGELEFGDSIMSADLDFLDSVPSMAPDLDDYGDDDDDDEEEREEERQSQPAVAVKPEPASKPDTLEYAEGASARLGRLSDRLRGNPAPASVAESEENTMDILKQLEQDDSAVASMSPSSRGSVPPPLQPVSMPAVSASPPSDCEIDSMLGSVVPEPPRPQPAVVRASSPSFALSFSVPDGIDSPPPAQPIASVPDVAPVNGADGDNDNDGGDETVDESSFSAGDELPPRSPPRRRRPATQSQGLQSLSADSLDLSDSSDEELLGDWKPRRTTRKKLLREKKRLEKQKEKERRQQRLRTPPRALRPLQLQQSPPTQPPQPQLQPQPRPKPNKPVPQELDSESSDSSDSEEAPVRRKAVTVVHRRKPREVEPESQLFVDAPLDKEERPRKRKKPSKTPASEWKPRKRTRARPPKAAKPTAKAKAKAKPQLGEVAKQPTIMSFFGTPSPANKRKAMKSAARRKKRSQREFQVFEDPADSDSDSDSDVEIVSTTPAPRKSVGVISSSYSSSAPSPAKPKALQYQDEDGDVAMQDANTLDSSSEEEVEEEESQVLDYSEYVRKPKRARQPSMEPQSQELVYANNALELESQEFDYPISRDVAAKRHKSSRRSKGGSKRHKHHRSALNSLSNRKT